MNRIGQVGIGSLIMVAVVVIIGLVFMQQSASDVSRMTNTFTVTNSQITAPAADASITLTGQAVSGFSATNGTSGTTIPASNYTITNYVLQNGELVSTFTARNGTSIGWQGKLINVTYTYEPFGYDRNSGNRAVISLIVIMFALAIAVVAMTPVLREGIVDVFR